MTDLPQSGVAESVSNPDPVIAPGDAGTSLTDDLALSQLKDRGLPSDAIEQMSRNDTLMKSRKVRIALAAHPHTPRRMALRLIRELYTFELVRFILTPAAVADLKRVAEQTLLTRLPLITLGERISLARRSSEAIAGALLLDQEKRVWQAALENPRLTEIAVVRSLQKSSATPALVEAICRHPRWSLRNEIRFALLRNAHTPLARAVEFAHRLPPAKLRDILHTSHLPEKIKSYLRKNATGK